MKWLVLILGILSNAGASVLVKIAVNSRTESFSLAHPTFWLDKRLLSGILCYGLAFVFYTLALRRLPLNLAQPILTGGAVALVALLSKLIFREALSATTVAGIVVIIAGIALISIRP